MVRRLWQSQRAEVVIADLFPVLVGVAEGVAAKPKFIMKVFPVRPHELFSLAVRVERRLVHEMS